MIPWPWLMAAVFGGLFVTFLLVAICAAGRDGGEN